MGTNEPLAARNGFHRPRASDAGGAIPAAGEKRPRRWMYIPIGLIIVQTAIVLTMVFIATNDPSFAVEPDYYKKALDWDHTAAQMESNRRLGWKTAVSVGAPLPDGAREIVISLSNVDGTALDGGTVEAEVFASRRSADRTVLKLEGRGGGRYAAAGRFAVPGMWECRVHIVRGPETFTSVETFEVAPKAGGAG